MRLFILQSIVARILGAGIIVQAGIIYNYGGSPYQIPDGNLSGVSSQITVSGAPLSLSDITVTLNLSGGYNGDLYAYLSYNGALVPLLNRIGVNASNPSGASGAGMNVTLADWGTVANGYNGNIHTAGNGVLSGTWQADGQNISPLSAPSSFSPNGGSITFDGTFGGVNPNGTWTLFFADVSTGGGTSTVNGWSLDITAVPEPVTVALAVFAALAIVIKLISWRHLTPLLPLETTANIEGLSSKI